MELFKVLDPNEGIIFEYHSQASHTPYANENKNQQLEWHNFLTKKFAYLLIMLTYHTYKHSLTHISLHAFTPIFQSYDLVIFLIRCKILTEFD